MSLKAIVTAIGISLASLSMAHAQTQALAPPDLSGLPPAVQTAINNAVAICVARPPDCADAYLTALDVLNEQFDQFSAASDEALGLFAVAIFVAGIDLPQRDRFRLSNVIARMTNSISSESAPQWVAILNLADALDAGTVRPIVAQIASPN
jgi:hypothetical protein